MICLSIDKKRAKRDHSYWMMPQNLVSINYLEFNLNIGKISEVVNLGVGWLAVSAKYICDQYGVTPIDARRMILWTLSSEDQSGILARMFSIPGGNEVGMSDTEYGLGKRSELRERMYLITERNISLINTLEYNMGLCNKSAVVNLAIEWMVRTFRDVCAMESCTNAEAKRRMLSLMSEESYSQLIATIVSSSIVALDSFDELVGMKA